MARRLGVCVLILLVLGETSGLARAFGPGSTVHCCCGTHASARPCPCPDCPVTLLRAHAKADHDSRLMAGRDCSGARTDEAGVLTVVALLAPSPTLEAPFARAALDFTAPPSLIDHVIDVARPPP